MRPARGIRPAKRVIVICRSNNLRLPVPVNVPNVWRRHAVYAVAPEQLPHLDIHRCTVFAVHLHHVVRITSHGKVQYLKTVATRRCPHYPRGPHSVQPRPSRPCIGSTGPIGAVVPTNRVDNYGKSVYDDALGSNKRFSIQVHVGHLAQEIVERPLAVGKRRRDIELIPWNSHVLVDIHRVVCPLVPHLACRAPEVKRPRIPPTHNRDSPLRVVAVPGCIRPGKENLRVAVTVNVRHHRIFRHRAARCRYGCAYPVESRTVEDVERISTAINNISMAVLVEVESCHTRRFAVWSIVVHDADIARLRRVV